MIRVLCQVVAIKTKSDSILYEFARQSQKTAQHQVMPDDHSKLVPLLPIPNRTVKRLCADDSAGSRVKVGHRQALTSPQTPSYLVYLGVWAFYKCEHVLLCCLQKDLRFLTMNENLSYTARLRCSLQRLTAERKWTGETQGRESGAVQSRSENNLKYFDKAAKTVS